MAIKFIKNPETGKYKLTRTKPQLKARDENEVKKDILDEAVKNIYTDGRHKGE